MPYSDPMFDDMDEDYSLLQDLRSQDHDMGMFDGMDDRFDDPMPEPNSDDLIIEGLRQKGIIVKDLYEDHDFDYGYQDFDLADVWEMVEREIADREEVHQHLQSQLIRKSEARQRQVTKHKLWAPKKN